MVCDQLCGLNLNFYGIGSWRNSQAFVCKISTLECGLSFLHINFILSIWALLINILLFSFKKVCSKLDTLFTDVVFICHPLAFMILSSLPRSEKTSWYWTCIQVWKSLGKLFDFREYFCAFYSGSGEADTTASSFTTSGEEPLETATSEMTGLLLKKISFSFRHGQWYPSCQHCNIFKKITGFFVGC